MSLARPAETWARRHLVCHWVSELPSRGGSGKSSPDPLAEHVVRFADFLPQFASRIFFENKLLLSVIDEVLCFCMGYGQPRFGGLAGGICVKALDLYARIRRFRNWNWPRPVD
jgi:hypothetical protein